MSESQTLLVGFLIFSHEVEHSVTPVVGGGVKTSDSDIMTSAVAKLPSTCLFRNQSFQNLDNYKANCINNLTRVVAMEPQTKFCSSISLD